MSATAGVKFKLIGLKLNAEIRSSTVFEEIRAFQNVKDKICCGSAENIINVDGTDSDRI